MYNILSSNGLPPVPPRLASKIFQREFIEMGELLPEFWGVGREETGERKEEPRPPVRADKGLVVAVLMRMLNISVSCPRKTSDL